MASCDELFQRKLQLDLERQRNDEQMGRLRNIQTSRVPEGELPDDAGFEKAQDDVLAGLNDPENKAAAAEGAQAAERRKQDAAAGVPKDKRTKVPEVNIGAGQPVNLEQLARDKPEEMVRDMATLIRSLSQVANRYIPGFRGSKLDSFTAKRETAQELLGGSKGAWTRILSEGSPLEPMLDQVLTMRFINDTASKAYLAHALDIRDWLAANPGKPLPDELKIKGFQNFKLSLMANRYMNQMRSSWGYLGHALQGQSYEGPLKRSLDELDPEIVEAISKTQNDMDNIGVNNVETIQEAANMRPSDLSEEMSWSQIIVAADKNRDNPGGAMEQLLLEINNIILRGTEISQKYDPKQENYNRFRTANALAKNHQLFNIRTQFLNIGSNFNMALLGPARTFLEDVQIVQDRLRLDRPKGRDPVISYGTELMEASRIAWQANWEGIGAAARAMRDGGKEVFLDAFKEGKLYYANNPETYGKYEQTEKQLVAELEALKRGGTRKGGLAKGLSWINPDRHRRFVHAASALWFYQKTGGKTFFLRPGFRSLGAFDNAAGYGFFNYKVRQQLEMDARMQGNQLNFQEGRTPEEAQIAQDEWINNKFKESFYSMQPTEYQIQQFRREQGISPDLMDDQAIADRIVTERVGETYGAPVANNPYSQAAADFSSEMRFTNKPTEGLQKNINEAAQAIRRHPIGDFQLPYWQAPFNGSGLDVALLGPAAFLRMIDPRIQSNPAKVRRMKANFAMAGVVYGIWASLSANDSIIGSGPADPEANRQWRMELAAQGKKPNSILGIQLQGGFPIINTMFLLQDIGHNFMYAGANQFDQQKAVGAALGALMGHLERASALGQVQQLFDIAFGDQNTDGKIGSFAGYMAAGQAPGIGVVRSIERLSNSQQSNLYRDADWTPEDDELIGRDLTEEYEASLRYWAYNFTGLAGVAGGAYKDKDWLGTPIRLPWGANFMDHWKNRFDPKLHPKDVVYPVLLRLKLLSAPQELIDKRLDGVPMSDDLQKEFNDTLGTIKGSTDPVAALQNSGVQTKWIARLPGQVKLRTPQGITVSQAGDKQEFDMSQYLGKHTKGKTVLEAYHSLINDPVFQAIESEDSVVASRVNIPNQLRNKQAAVLMLNGIKEYYAHMTKTLFENQQNPSPAVALWQQRLAKLRDDATMDTMNSLGSSTGRATAEARVKAMSDALNKSE